MALESTFETMVWEGHSEIIAFEDLKDEKARDEDWGPKSGGSYHLGDREEKRRQKRKPK